ncbi:TauD/TfdA family dioxygenase [Bradyrhizobium sp. CB1015]|uniref:TauD/TfdA dioxygenase family protein n=1 Tax=Bradyrhizobium sp. CB1015 TaxID=2976822 RepID=UPI0021AA006A|nr:TauD/TfdA family dioxygenase [Bradyrhizobium sp. CB1015]UWU92918.1 TauD/TfdA family dioxygenase [Bradyrhizobium sp. CB1015]
MLSLRPLTDTIGTEVSGIDLAGPISGRDFDRIYATWLNTTILLFRNQSMTPQQQIDFSRRFGDLLVYTRSENALPDHPEVLVLSNLKKDGKAIGSSASGRYWHSDGHYLKCPPAASLLYAAEVPPSGGDTWFANMQAAYDALPAEIKVQIDSRQVIISRVKSRPYNYPEKPPVTPEERAAWPDMPQPLVRTHPRTGRKALYVGGNVPWNVVGMPEAESNILIPELQSFATQPRFIYIHRWRAGDAILWDNRSSIHRATPYDEVNHQRLMYRTTIAGEEAF